MGEKGMSNGAVGGFTGGAVGGGRKQAEMKLVLIGREGVGKSCLMMQYISHSFDETHEPTLEDTSFTQRVVDGQPWRLQIIDTAGQEEFQYLVQQYYQSGHGFLAVFDLCNKDSMLELQSMFTKIARSKDLLDNSTDPIHHHVPCVIVGNKNDLPRDQFQVSDQEIETFRRQFEFPFFSTSAKTPCNVEEAFECLIRETARKVFSDTSQDAEDTAASHHQRKPGSKRQKSKLKNGVAAAAKCVIS